MKYLIFRCEDLGGAGAQTPGLLEGTKTLFLQQLAQAGAAGFLGGGRDTSARRRVGPSRSGLVGDRLHVHRGLLGLRAHEPIASPGACYAHAAGARVEDAETVWCCEFVTQRDQRLVDPTAGRISTKESRLLVEALNSQLGSEARRWGAGEGPHHVLMTSDPLLQLDGARPVKSPERIVGARWKDQLPRGTVGQGLRVLLDQASKVLESHEVNRVRVDLNENPANQVWCWGAAGSDQRTTFSERTQMSGALVSRSFPVRGLAKSFGLAWEEAPSGNDEQSIMSLQAAVRALLEKYDLVYTHLEVDTGDPVERLCNMERVDQLFLQPVTEWLQGSGEWRILAVIDDRCSRGIPWVGCGSGLAPNPVARLDRERLEHGRRVPDAAALFGWFTSGRP